MNEQHEHSTSQFNIFCIRRISINSQTNHGRFARWRKWRACDVGEAKEWLENELWLRWSNRVAELQPSHHFAYVTAHSPTLPSLHLRHSSFSNLFVASPTSQLILQSFFRFSYVTGSSLTLPGEPPMVCLAVNGYCTYTEYIELTCTVFMLFIHKLHYI